MTSASYPTLRRAPIVEALIDIQVRLPASTNLAVLERFQDAIKQEFPSKAPRISIESSINFSEAKARFTNQQEADGYLFRSVAEDMVVQARLDGFTFSKLRPYTKWADVSLRAHQLWEHYVKIADPMAVTRLALRYVNRLELPNGADFKDYVLTAPEIAPSIPQGVSEFLLRAIVPDPDGPGTAIITETSEPAQQADFYPLIFDIDVFEQVEMPPRESAMWSKLEYLRTYKNRIFFGTITERLLEKYR